MDGRELAERLGRVGAAQYASVDLLQRLAGMGATPDHVIVMGLADEIARAIEADRKRIEAGTELCKRLPGLVATPDRECPTGF